METRNPTQRSAAGTFLTGLAAGLFAEYFLDPVGGGRRRTLARDWAAKQGHQIGESLRKVEDDARDRASGVLGEARGALLGRSVRADTLEQRLRAAIGRAASPPSAVPWRRNGGRGLAPRTPPGLLGAILAVGALGVAYALRGPALGAATRPRGIASALRPGRNRADACGAARPGQKVREVMTTDPVSCAPTATADDAARLMRDHHIGDVLVCQDGRLTGIVTDRDLVVRVVADGLRPDERRLADICSHDIVTVSPEDEVDRAVELMKERAVRRLPVCEADGRLLGVVSIGDLAIARDQGSALGRISAAPAND